MTEKQRSNNKQPPWQREGDTEAVPFGPWLRRQREMREITLREISDATKISLRYLQALEDERFDLLPAMVFAKGFLRQYARYVGLDQDEVVNRFLIASRAEGEDEEGGDRDDATARGRSGAKGAGGSTGSMGSKVPMGSMGSMGNAGSMISPGRSPAFDGAWKYAILIAVVAVALLAAVFLLPRLLDTVRGHRSAEPPPGVTAPEGAAAPASSPAAAAESAGQAPDQAPDQTGAGQPAAGQAQVGLADPRIGGGDDAPLRVTLDFREDCWVEATVDGARRVSEMRVQGESLQLQAQHEVDLRLGNADVVDIEVNGRPYPLEATPGQVRRVQIDLSDLPSAAGGNGGASAAEAAPPAETGVRSQP